VRARTLPGRLAADRLGLGYRLDAPQGVGARIAKLVADSDPHDPATAPDRMIGSLSRFYARHIRPIGNSETQ
jgi:hypothetical protein